MNCPACHKGARAFHYCHRPQCPRSLAAVQSANLPPAHARFNAFLATAKGYESLCRSLADAAYGISQDADTGHRTELIHIGDAATTFAGLVNRMKPL